MSARVRFQRFPHLEFAVYDTGSMFTTTRVDVRRSGSWNLASFEIDYFSGPSNDGSQYAPLVSYVGDTDKLHIPGFSFGSLYLHVLTASNAVIAHFMTGEPDEEFTLLGGEIIPEPAREEASA